MREPTIRTRIYHENGVKYRMKVHAGLHKIGEQAPYFTLTAEIDKQRKDGRWVDYMGGCCQDEILRFYPELADIAALHLSDIDGAPMHAMENGWYWLSGGCFVFGEWKNAETNSGKSTAQVFAEHVRIPLEEAERMTRCNHDTTKGQFAEWIEAQRPRWKAEADACIAKHNLQIFKS